MKKSTIGAILILALAGLAIGVWKIAAPYLAEREQISTSDATTAKATIRIGGDGYLGYWFITSPEMRKQTSRKGLAVQFEDDGGAYAERLQKFADEELDAIVLPINSYLEHGARHKFPGVIVAAIAESKGADGIVGFENKFPEQKVGELNDASLKIVYTPESPSSFLLDLTVVDFDLFNLTSSNNWRVEADGSSEVYKMAKRGEGDAFVMWEPELSNALADMANLRYIWGSDKFGGYIVDVLVVHRDYLKKHKSELTQFLESYFMTMNTYANNRNSMLKDIQKSVGIKSNVAENMLKKIDWCDLSENCVKQFGVELNQDVPATEGIAACIIVCTDVMKRTGVFQSDPLTGNPYLIINSSIVEELAKRSPVRIGGKSASRTHFTELNESEWTSLPEIGAMRVEPITFQSGRSLLDASGKDQVNKIGKMLIHNYPQYRVAVRGHTGPGDAVENQKLSLERAKIVVKYLRLVHNIDENRLHAEGLGATQPPEKRPGESTRAYRYRLPRVEFVLLEDNSL